MRPYPYPPWGPYTGGGAVDTNWFDASTQAQVQTQTQIQTQGSVRRKRGRAGASGEDGLRIVLVQPKGALAENAAAAASTTNSISLVSTSTSSPVRTAASDASDDPSRSPPSSSTANSPRDEESSIVGPATPADSGEQVGVAMVRSFLVLPIPLGLKSHLFQRTCSSEACRRRLPNGTSGSLCERCKIRLKRRQEKTRLRLKLEPRKSRLPSRRLET
jgi:hypothetical protein